MNTSLRLFCDGSVHPQSHVGFGAYFIMKNDTHLTLNATPNIHLKKFTQTSSTRLELEVLLWALNDKLLQDTPVEIFTDCQNILNLKQRREKLEQNHFKSSKGKLLKNHLLYKEFYALTDILECQFIKVKGHKASDKKGEIDKLFNLVDKSSRKALRSYLQMLSS